MRAFYSTQRQFRVFILGTPEGWHVSVYDLYKNQWLEKDDTMEETLRTAKATAHEKVALLLGKNTPDLQWH